MNTTSEHTRLPRSEWASHPHFPSQALLLGSHANFRRVNRFLVEAASDAEPMEIELLYRRWIRAMRSHEAYEEHKLYPYLARRWKVSFASAEEGHVALHEKHASVLSAFDALRRSGGESTRGQLIAALEEHEEVLKEHLRVEEDLVIPLLLAMEPDEFEHYANSSIGRLLYALEEQGL